MFGSAETMNGDPRTFAQSAQAKLSQDILAGRLRPSAKLKLNHLCELYGVGTSPCARPFPV